MGIVADHMSFLGSGSDHHGMHSSMVAFLLTFKPVKIVYMCWEPSNSGCRPQCKLCMQEGNLGDVILVEALHVGTNTRTR
jgi:hypothetical protein